MKKTILFLSIMTLTCCNNRPSIPPNSVYQEGDVVYSIDSCVAYDKYEGKYTGLRVDVDFIYREKKNEIRMKNYNPTNASALLDNVTFIKRASKDVDDHQYIFLIDNHEDTEHDTIEYYVNNDNIMFIDNGRIQMTFYYSAKTNY